MLEKRETLKTREGDEDHEGLGKGMLEKEERMEKEGDDEVKGV